MAPRWRTDDDDEFDPAFDDDFAGELEDDGDDNNDDRDDDDDDNTVPCPHCDRDIYEDAPRCPHCGRYTADADEFGSSTPSRMKPLWIVIGSLACMYAIVRWVFG